MPYRIVDGARIWWPKYVGGRRPTKGASLAYWRDRAEGATMAKRPRTDTTATDTKRGFRKVPSDLNLWPPGDSDPPKGTQLTCLVSHVNPAGPFGLQVKVCDPEGTIWTLASHKVLQGRLESVPGGLRPMQTVLRITYTGTEKAKKWPTPMQMYDLEYADRVGDGMIDLFAKVVPAEQTF